MVNYQAYLKSKEWRAKREWALERADHRCQLCNSDAQLQVHHRTYENLGHELPADLIVLCRSCHEKHHNRLARPPRLPPPPHQGIPNLGTERTLILGMINHVHWIEGVVEHLEANDFEDAGYREIFKALREPYDPQGFPHLTDPMAVARLRELLASPDVVSVEMFDAALRRMLLIRRMPCWAGLARRAAILSKSLDRTP